MHWHRPGVDISRGTCNGMTACRRFYVADLPHHHTDDATRVSCLKCVAIMPDYLADIRATVRAERGISG